MGRRNLTKCLLVLCITLVCFSGTNGGWWRRRRRRCSRQNCVWGQWSAWSACNHPCGHSGTQTSTRGVARGPSCGGAGCSGPSSRAQACNRFCYNGGTPQHGHCTCRDAFWGTCCPSPCTVIAHCERIVCNSGSDQQCRRCQYTRSASVNAYTLVASGGHTNRVCQQRCSWRPDSKYCYPGKCPSTPASCACATGYGGNNCMTISTKPDITHCLAKAMRIDGGAERDKADAGCDAVNAAKTVYTNVRANRIELDWKSMFVGPNAATYPKPYYVKTFRVGVVSALAEWKLLRGSSAVAQGTIACTNANNRDNPNISLMSCKNHGDIAAALQHRDKLQFTAKSINGGFVTINNYDNPNVDVNNPPVNAPQYYSGATVGNTAHFTFDFNPPTHCSLTSSTCPSGAKMLDRGAAFTKNENIQIRWSGWEDADSGITGFEYDVYKLQAYGDKISYRTQSPVKTGKVAAASTSFPTITLTDPGVYCVVLTIDDVAGNHNRARRFFMFDKTTTVTINPSASHPLRVQSATSNTAYTWLTDTTSNVLVKWQNHFYNDFHRTHKLLAAIEPNTPPLGAAYEEQTGQPPSTRSMEAIPGINGIVKFNIGHRTDRAGGRTIVSPGTMTPVANIKAEQQALTIARKDGDSVRIFVEAIDVMGNKNMDNVLVHVDSSPPIITDMWLVRHGERMLAVHHSLDLFDMSLNFTSYDDHSGLKEIYWELHDMANPQTIHGYGQIAVRKPPTPAECKPPNCACIPKGECYYRDFTLKLDANKMNIPGGKHDYDYFFVIRTTNVAMLQTTKKFKVTVDVTPPKEGVVLDSLPGQPDIDFQQGLTVNAHWQGFFDRESSIFTYQYIISNKCEAASAFSLTSGSAQRTTGTSAKLQATRPGKYYCTVVAYNKALSPSHPVCSSGVTIDNTPPQISEINIQKLRMRSGLIKKNGGATWLIDSEGYLTAVSDSACGAKAKVVSDIDIYPKRRYSNGTAHSINTCTGYKQPSAPLIHEENHLELSWKGGDAESGIYDYQVALSSSGSASKQDIIPFTSTKGHASFLTYHPNLRQGSTFYIHVKAINKARQEAVKVYGPIMVDVTPPKFTGKIAVSLANVNNQEFLLAKWNAGAFTETESFNEIKTYSMAIGHNTVFEEVKKFSEIKHNANASSVCSDTQPPSCVAIDVTSLDWHLHGDHVYYVHIMAENLAGLKTIATSEPYKHYQGLPSKGVLSEIDLDATAIDKMDDIDYQTNRTSLRVRWSGFYHPHQEVTIFLGLGLAHSTSKDTIVAYTQMAQGVSEYLFTGLQLEDFKTYFTTIKARNELGSVEVSSDGITIVPRDVILNNTIVADGPSCLRQGSKIPTSSQHHDRDILTPVCGVDIDYQTSTTAYNVHWNISETAQNFVTHVQWALQRREAAGSSNARWVMVREFENVGKSSHALAANLHMTEGQLYRALVKPCHSGGCFQALPTDGVYITPSPPLGGSINDVEYENGTKNLQFSWTNIRDPKLTGEAAKNYVASYEWTLAVADGAQSLKYLYPWKRIPDSALSTLSYRVQLKEDLTFTKCTRLILRGTSGAGTFVSFSRTVRPCTKAHITPSVVIDAVGAQGANSTLTGDIHLEKNAHWLKPDAEYTPSSTKLSAVWPTLRHGHYEWRVVKGNTGPSSQLPNLDCSSVNVLRCGQTKENFINVDSLTLQEGSRYHVCIHANATTLKFEKFDLHLPSVSVCSDGVTIDLSPPQKGQVWIGNRGQNYQASKSEIFVRWTSFVDVEGLGNAAHHSSVWDYQYAIGTSPYGVDVLDYTSAGVTNMAVVHSLKLQDGHTYYATIKARDFVDHVTKVTSQGVTIDTSPPEVTEEKIDQGGRYQTSTSAMSAKWQGLFVDKESGVYGYEWCIGSRSGYCDKLPFTWTSEEQASTGPSLDLKLQEGHSYFVTVKCHNGAGLTSMATSWAILVDRTPPSIGHVYDGKTPGRSKDLDYQIETDRLWVRWEGFHDPHSSVIGYSMSIGTCPGCDDVLEKSSIGLKGEQEVSGLHLAPGRRYYSTVEACNAAGLCTVVTSDGIVPDNSPPSPGIVYNGIATYDIKFQSTRTVLSAHWLNFHDPHSGISHYEVLAGTTAGGSDIQAWRHQYQTDRIIVNPLTSPLPLNKRIYITLRAFNKAGLSTERTSSGFVVDNTPPIVVERARVNLDTGSLLTNTQVFRTLMNVQWKFKDDESAIYDQYLSITTNHQTDFSVPTLKVPGSATQQTFSNLTLWDGNTYTVTVTACNGARLCTRSESLQLKVDSTPPSRGAFAAQTEHAANLPRHVAGWMTYENKPSPVLKLSWLGFADAHTGVTKYRVTVGTTYDGRNLNKAGSPVVVQHTSGPSHYGDEGSLQKGTIPLSSALSWGQKIYIAVWAENGVGMVSKPVHGTFTVVKSSDTVGLLDLNRRCASQSCEGHCTCGPSYRCTTSAACKNVKGNAAYKQVTVKDTLQLLTANPSDISYTPSQCILGASWTVAPSGGSAPVRYEWSVGIEKTPPGNGLIPKQKEEVWHDAGLRTKAVFPVSRDPTYSMKPHVAYIFYVRAWYDANSFAVFTSNGVRTDNTAPALSKSRHVKEVRNPTSTEDINFITDKTSVTVKWKSVFHDSQASLKEFLVGLGTYRGAADVVPFSSTRVQGSVTSHKLTGLALKSGTRYYSSVIGVNQAGLSTIATSNGFLVDDEAPSAGVVWDGQDLHDLEYQNHTTSISASWHGFSDLQSFIRRYVWCVGTRPGQADILACKSVGIRTSVSSTVTLKAGTKYFSTVHAVDAAGLLSAKVSSDGVTIITTPPEPSREYTVSANIVQNPSFEGCSSGTGLNGWTVQGVVASVGHDSAVDGACAVRLSGNISQTVTTKSGGIYRIEVSLAHDNASHGSGNAEGFIHAPGIHETFLLYPRPYVHDRGTAARRDHKWSQHVHFFTATTAASLIRIGSLHWRQGFLVDNVKVQLVQHRTGDQSKPESGAVRVQLGVAHGWNSIHADWHFTDPLGGVISYFWAIGTVKGGTQIQPFKTTGRRSYARNDDVLLLDGSLVHVTVMAQNEAGLSRVVYANPVLIDLSPPQVCCIQSERYATQTTISIIWLTRDDQSGIKSCELALGKTPTTYDIQDYQQTPMLDRATVNLAGKVSHGTVIYASVRCHNKAGLHSVAKSDGVTMVLSRPSANKARVFVIGSSRSHYPVQDGHQSVSDVLHMGWDGFKDDTGIRKYWVRVVNGQDSVTNWQLASSSGEKFADLRGLSLTGYQTYQVLLKAENVVGLQSDVVSTNFTIETDPPKLQHASLTDKWPKEWIMDLDWTGSFTSNSSMFYEMTIGTAYGSSDVVQWKETKNTKIRITGVDHSKEHFVVITAVNKAGLYNTHTYKISYKPTGT